MTSSAVRRAIVGPGLLVVLDCRDPGWYAHPKGTVAYLLDV